MAAPGLDEIITTTSRNRKMEPKKPNVKDALKVAQTGRHVPEKDFSPKAKIEDATKGPDKGGSLATVSALPTPSATITTVSPSGKASHGYGHPVTAREGHLRHSGHGGAHRIGKKK